MSKTIYNYSVESSSEAAHKTGDEDHYSVAVAMESVQAAG